MVRQFDRNGICFQYPENWQLDDQSEDASGSCLTLQSPGTGFWMLQDFSADRSPDKLAADVLRSMRQDYDSIEARLVREQLGDVEAVGYDMHFYCLDFVVAAKVRSFAAEGRQFVIVYQAEDREFEQLEPVFSAITISLLRSLEK